MICAVMVLVSEPVFYSASGTEYRDVPSICYHLFVLEIRLLNSMLKFRYEVLHYYLSFDYLCIIFGRLVRLFLL